MSVLPDEEPVCLNPDAPTVALDLEARPRNLGDGFTVRRLLPSLSRMMVGPFIFFDHMGPVRLPPEHGLDVRPHPHINLATVTYLFDGEILHRDSLGTEQLIRPGAVNWMTAGRGIVHSERSPASARQSGPFVHGLQLWVALPTAKEEVEPSFQHHGEKDIPELDRPGVRLRVIAGTAFGVSAPVQVYSPLFYVDVSLERGAKLTLPSGSDLPEDAQRAAYVVDGAVSCDGKTYRAGTMLVFREGATPILTANDRTRMVLLGGARLDGERHIWWNFVSSRRERIEEAKRAWRERRFPSVPGDDQEFIPLPAALGKPR